MNEGLKTSLNKIRELSSDIYQRYIPIIENDTDIAKFGESVLNYPVVANEFYSQLVNQLVYTQLKLKSFRNKLNVLEGDKIPFGYGGKNIHVNPAKGRQFNVNDFAGLLARYEADVKVEYHTINADLQYPVTYTREQLKKAFSSMNELESFINGITQSLYNGAYIDEYNFTKELVSSAYKENRVVTETVSAVTDESTAKSFLKKCRELFLNMQEPTTKFNVWHRIKEGADRPVTTWSNPEDIVLIIRNDVLNQVDVESLARAFNIEYTKFLGQVIAINDFDVYAEDGTKVYDGSNILGFIGDRSWFNIKKADEFLETFYNPNNRTLQVYLNTIKMYRTSLFANGVVLCTSVPSIAYTSLSYGDTTTVTVEQGDIEGLDLIGLPVGANATINYTSGSTSVFTVEKSSEDQRHCTITGVGVGTSTLTVASGTASTTLKIAVK